MENFPANDSGQVQSDSGTDALSMHLLNIMRSAIESAGAVRDLVHQDITEDAHSARTSKRLFEKAMDEIPHAPSDVQAAFNKAFRKAQPMPVPGIKETRDIILEEMDMRSYFLEHHGKCHAATEAFAMTFPDGVRMAVQPHRKPSNKNAIQFPQSRIAFMMNDPSKLRWDPPPVFAEMIKIFQMANDITIPDKNKKDITKVAFKKAYGIATRKIIERATSPDPTFALCAAAAAVMVASILDYGIQAYLHSQAKRDHTLLAQAISQAGDLPLETAALIPKAMLEGARIYRDNTEEAAGEVAVRAIRTAHMWVSRRAGTAVFCGIYELIAGATWAASTDTVRFENMYKRALKVAGNMDPRIKLLFNPLADDESDIDDELDLGIWDFFYGASGHTLDEWARIAGTVDYKAAALLPENAPMMDLYRSYYEESKRAIKPLQT